MSCRKTEVVNLLETAGFSRANPYYVVQQGKVCSTTLFFCPYQAKFVLAGHSVISLSLLLLYVQWPIGLDGKV